MSLYITFINIVILITTQLYHQLSNLSLHMSYCHSVVEIVNFVKIYSSYCSYNNYILKLWLTQSYNKVTVNAVFVYREQWLTTYVTCIVKHHQCFWPYCFNKFHLPINMFHHVVINVANHSSPYVSLILSDCENSSIPYHTISYHTALLVKYILLYRWT